MKRSIWIHWLRFWAYVLDSVGRKHNLWRRVGAYSRKKTLGGQVQCKDPPPEASQ